MCLIPLRKKEIKEFAGGEGIDMLVLAENMAWVMGCDPHFKYTKDYAGDPEEAVQLQAVRRHDEGRARCCRTR